MSWWFGVNIDTGGSERHCIADRNMTYNLAPMLSEALGSGFRELDGAPCTEAAAVLSRAVERMKADPEHFKTMDPPNGWGDYHDALESLTWLVGLCESHPRASIYVH